MSGEAKIREENDSLSNSIHPQSSVNQIKNFNQEQLSKNEDSPQMIEGESIQSNTQLSQKATEEKKLDLPLNELEEQESPKKLELSEEQKGSPSPDKSEAKKEPNIDDDMSRDEDDNLNELQEDVSPMKAKEKNKQEVEQMVQKMIEECETSGKMYEDKDFGQSEFSLYIDPSNRPDYAKDVAFVEWKRPNQLCEDPLFYANGQNSNDIRQGNLGNCWFLGALTTLTTIPDLLSNLVVYNGMKNGFMVFQFYRNGSWYNINIDTAIPCNPKTKKPIYSACSTANEFWVPLLEKGYAKLFGCYERMNKGKIAEGLVDLTGGISEKFNFADPQVAEQISSGQFWKLMKKFKSSGYLLGCNYHDKNKKKEPEYITPQGIFWNHAYGIMDLYDTDGVQLLKLRNPWGMGEWSGPFSEEDDEWDKHKGLKEKLGTENKKDQSFYIHFNEWKTNFNRLYLCKIFSNDWKIYSIGSQFEGKTNGGPPPTVEEDKKEENAPQQHLDTDDKWFNNPQFRLVVKKNIRTLIISMMQPDNTINKKPYLNCNFLIMSSKNPYDRIWDFHQENIVCKALDDNKRVAQREITLTTSLQTLPNKKPAYYIIVPYLYEIKKDPKPFCLRIFSSDPLDVAVLPETIETTLKGDWGVDSAGGKRLSENNAENSTWCKNPQIFLNLIKPTHVKIILKKTGKNKKNKAIPVGLVIAKAILGTKGLIKPPNSKNFKGAKNTLNNQQNVGEVPPLSKIDRKLRLLHNEWFKETSYQHEDIGAFYTFWQTNEGPFLIVPTLSKPDITAGFVLTLYTSNMIELVKLDDAKNKVITDQWTKESSGGCHLNSDPYEMKDNATWKNNPKFNLIMKGDTQ